jgi:hypothetical protein
MDDHDHVWTYGNAARSREPYRHCGVCDSVEVYYLDDYLAEEGLLE